MVTSVTAFIAWIALRPQVDNHIKALTEWQKLRSLYSMGIYDTNGYAEFYSVLNYNYKFLFDYGHSLNKLGEYEKSNEILHLGTKLSNDPMFHNIIGNNYLSIREYEKAEKSYMRAYHLVPNRIYPLYLLTKLYHEQGDTVKTIELCRKVIEFIPKIYSPAVSEIKENTEALLNTLLGKNITNN